MKATIGFFFLERLKILFGAQLYLCGYKGHITRAAVAFDGEEPNWAVHGEATHTVPE